MVSNTYKFGLALSGGGSRAIAFHLGCMRALNDRDILRQIRTLSTVSGGSVIGALWAYSDDSFDDFDLRVQALLRTGLTRGIARYTLFSRSTFKIVATVVTSGLMAALGSIVRLGISGIEVVGLSNGQLRALKIWLQSPLRRFASRTTAFVQFLDSEYFHGVTLAEVKRPDLQIVMNAAELRTQSAYRFGSLESGCWRFGRLTDETLVAKAVAASAAFPVFLPALDEKRRYIKRDKIGTNRTIVTDGGVYDNLGTSCLTPGRTSEFSTNVTKTDFIIACVAGQGVPDGSVLPYFWPSRLIATFNTVHRRTHSMAFNSLHKLRDSGQINGFLLPYLGQNDDALPCPPADLVPRAETFNYPTDFHPMNQDDIELIAKRGEQLTRNLIETHYPSL